MPDNISLSELKQYLPKFDCSIDLQIGDWVVVTPERSAALLTPLISMWEGTVDGESSVTAVPPRYSLTSFLPSSYVAAISPAPLAIVTTTRSKVTSTPSSLDNELPKSDAVCAVVGVCESQESDLAELASLSTAWSFFRKRKRHRGRYGSDGSRCCIFSQTMSNTTHELHYAHRGGLLYLHVRLGLLTPTTPLIFRVHGTCGMKNDEVYTLLYSRSNGHTFTHAISLDCRRVGPPNSCAHDGPAPLALHAIPSWVLHVNALAEAEWHKAHTQGRRTHTKMSHTQPCPRPSSADNSA